MTTPNVRIAITLMAASLITAGPASAQTQSGQTPATNFVPPPRYIEDDAERRAEQIKEQNFRTEHLGQQGGLNLDLGNFKRPDDDKFVPGRGLNDLENERANSYSGARIRVPLGGKQ